MTRQNRVLPTGEIVAIPLRGAFMGNRGILHDEQGKLGAARWRHRNWVCCALEFRGRKRTVMAPGRYTELFFFDEAVALAAGHRPCGECRRADHERFLDAWETAFGIRPKAADVDAALHGSRAERGGRRLRRHQAAMADLPDGAFVFLNDRPALVVGSRVVPLGPDGYGEPRPRPAGEATVLTSAVMVDVLRTGYRPALSLLA